METGMYFWIVILKQGIQFHDIVTWNFSASQIPFSKLKIIFIQHRHSQSKILLLYLMLYAYIIHDCWNAAHDILIASAETLCELINSPWVSFSTVLFKAAIHLTGQNHLTLACLEPLDHGAVPLGQLVAVPSLLELAEGREPFPVPPSLGTLQLSGTHTQALASFVSWFAQHWGWSKHRIPAAWIGTMTRLDHIVQSVAGTKWLLSRNLITESSNVQDAKNYMRQNTNSLLKFDMRFRIWFKGFFFFFNKKSRVLHCPLPKSIPSAAVNFPKWFAETVK